MKRRIPAPVKLRTQIEQWPLIEPFRLTGYTFTSIEVLLVTLEKEGSIGRGEAAGIYYKNDTASSMLAQVESLRSEIEAGVDHESAQTLLPPGGARNALDCAAWDLEAKLSERPVWELAGLENPRPVLTTFGCGAEPPEKMAAVARAYLKARAIKLKLTGEPVDADRVRAVREARPDVWLSIDANQGFVRKSLEQLMPVLIEADVKLIEQPFPVGDESLLDGFQSPIPVAADESLQTLSDLTSLRGRFDAINIKLDKCGGLTEALAIARQARALGLDPMVGNMIGTSLAMAPAFLVGQLCAIVDLDGPLFLQADRSIVVDYSDGHIQCPLSLWGDGRS